MRRAHLLAVTALATLAAPLPGLAGAAHAQAQAQTQTYEFDIPAQPLSRSVNQVASRANMQVLYAGDDSRGVDAPAIKGRMTADEALTRLLAGSGYTYRYSQPGVITLQRTSAEGNGEGERVTSAVRVEGTTGSPYFGGAGQAAGVNGVNGSRDITATEGTRSFTSGALTIGSKAPQAMKDVPQSLSVLTSERMQQQNVTDFTTAMRQLPGVSLVQEGTSLDNKFYSRGFRIQSIQIDGGAPIITGSTALGDIFFPQIDMSIYDHVELLRGAAGQFASYGDPGGTVNLVRKKPLDHAQFSIEGQAGSWSNYRVVADATSPLALGGKLRGRVVMTYQDSHHFYDVAKDNKTLIYGIAELDASPTTLVTAGISYTRQDSVPMVGGLPRYFNGDDIGLPRSSSLTPAWNKWDFDTTEIFGSIEQKFGKDWTLKLNLTDNRQSSLRKTAFSSGAVSPFTKTGPHMEASYLNYASKQFSAELALSGAFTLFGQRQEVTIGANRSNSDGGGVRIYDDYISTLGSGYQPYSGGPIYCTAGATCPAGSINSLLPVNVFTFSAADPLYTEPHNPMAIAQYPANKQVQTGAYINLRLTAFDRLHLVTGFHWSRYEYLYIYQNLCTTTVGSCAGKAIGDVRRTTTYAYSDEDTNWPPPVSLSFDVTRSLTAYVGYTNIYESQANLVDASLKPLPPITGANWEAGLKWAARNGKLNLSLAGFRIDQKGMGAVYPPDYSNYYEVRPGVQCCYAADPEGAYRSTGVDLEASGEIRAGWQVSASWTWSENKRLGSAMFGTGAGQPFITITPQNLYKLWTTYDFGAAGHGGALSGLSLSGGINGQSSGFRSGTVCTTDYYAPYPDVPFYKVCRTKEEPYQFTVPPYAVLSSRVDWRLSDKWSLAVNVENIFDKRYYQTTGSVTGGNWYGAPRNVTATLRAKW